MEIFLKEKADDKHAKCGNTEDEENMGSSSICCFSNWLSQQITEHFQKTQTRV